MNTIDTLGFLRSVSRFTENKYDDRELFKSYLLDRSNNYEILLQIHKLQYIFIKKLFDYDCSEHTRRITRENFSSQLLSLQFLYKEYLEILSQLCKDFENENITYCILKGFSITEALYNIEGVIYRPFSDIDILISPNHLSKAQLLLEKYNFIQGKIKGRHLMKAARSELIYWKLNSHQLHEYIKYSKYSNISPMFSITIDINTTIFEGGIYTDPIPMDVLFQNTITKEFSNISIKCLNPTFELLQLCYHFYKDTKYEIKAKTHENYCLLKFCDIREYIKRYYNDIRWNDFLNITNDAKIGDQIYYSLSMVSNFYNDLNISDILKQIKTTFLSDSQEIDWHALLIQ